MKRTKVTYTRNGRETFIKVKNNNILKRILIIVIGTALVATLMLGYLNNRFNTFDPAKDVCTQWQECQSMTQTDEKTDTWNCDTGWVNMDTSQDFNISHYSKDAQNTFRCSQFLAKDQCELGNPNYKMAMNESYVDSEMKKAIQNTHCDYVLSGEYSYEINKTGYALDYHEIINETNGTYPYTWCLNKLDNKKQQLSNDISEYICRQKTDAEMKQTFCDQNPNNETMCSCDEHEIASCIKAENVQFTDENGTHIVFGYSPTGANCWGGETTVPVYRLGNGDFTENMHIFMEKYHRFAHQEEFFIGNVTQYITENITGNCVKAHPIVQKAKVYVAVTPESICSDDTKPTVIPNPDNPKEPFYGCEVYPNEQERS